MNETRMPKLTRYKEDGTEETIKNIPAYFYYLDQIALRTLRQLVLLDGLDDDDIKIVIDQMQKLNAKKKEDVI